MGSRRDRERHGENYHRARRHDAEGALIHSQTESRPRGVEERASLTDQIYKEFERHVDSDANSRKRRGRELLNQADADYEARKAQALQTLKAEHKQNLRQLSEALDQMIQKPSLGVQPNLGVQPDLGASYSQGDAGKRQLADLKQQRNVLKAELALLEEEIEVRSEEELPCEIVADQRRKLQCLLFKLGVEIRNQEMVIAKNLLSQQSGAFATAASGYDGRQNQQLLMQGPNANGAGRLLTWTG